MQKLEEIEYDPKIRLGEGSYGTVFPGTYKGKQVAVKMVRLIDADENEEHTLKRLNHPNIVKLFHVENDVKDKYFALEFCDASMDQLFLGEKHAKKYRGPKLPSCFTVLLQLACGLEHIHSQNLIHRDIKPENVLISVALDQKLTIKWADFGLSKPVNERGSYTMTRVRGTMNWMAPELLEQLDDDEEIGIAPVVKRRGTVKSDVFAQGLVFGYFMSNGKHLFGSSSRKIESNISENNPVNLASIKSSCARKLLLKMLESDPGKRTSQEVVQQLQSTIKELERMETNLFKILEEKDVDLQAIKALIGEGVDVNCVNQEGLTPFLHLMKGCSNKTNLTETIRLLIDNNIEVNSKDNDGWNALHFLCRLYLQDDLIDLIQILIQYGIVTDSTNNDGKNALHLLCQYYKNDNITDIVRVLIENGINVNTPNNSGWNALHFSCYYYQRENLIDLVRLFIVKGIEFNRTKNSGENALQILCHFYRYNNWIEIMRLLVENGIDVNNKSIYGWTALHSLCKAKHNELNLIDEIRLLIEQDIDVNTTNEDGWNALLILCQNYKNENLIDIVRLFIEKGINVNTTNDGGWNALITLCQNYKNENLFDIVRLFIENGIDVNSANDEGWNALQYLCQYYKNENLIDIVRLLIIKGIDVNWKNRRRWNALQILCKYYSNDNLIDIAQLLIEHKINLNNTANEGNALHLLCKYYPNENLADILQLLILNGITVRWNGVDPRILISQNINQAHKDRVIQLLNQHMH